MKVDDPDAGELTMLAPWIHFSKTPAKIEHAGPGPVERVTVPANGVVIIEGRNTRNTSPSAVRSVS